MAMKVEIKDNKLYIEIDLETPTPSASGKTLVVASTRGNAVTDAKGKRQAGHHRTECLYQTLRNKDR